MIVCSNCNHLNPDGATQCEACFTPLPIADSCPNCGAPVQLEATFCGQCGFNLKSSVVPRLEDIPEVPPPEAAFVSVIPKFDPNSEVVTGPVVSHGQTQLQSQAPCLLHVQTGTRIELPNLPVVHIGKANQQVPPDIDVSGFPESEIVSRIHADIRSEAGVYYIEDMGSSNGTYVNHTPLPMGNRHRLRSGDRISLGKGDKITFIFQFS